MARFFPLTSTPTKRERSHFFALRLEHASGICLAKAISSAIVCSAAAPMFPLGLFTTITPSWVAALTSTLSTPTPALATTLSFLAAFRSVSVTLVSERMRRASYSPIIAMSSSADRPFFSSTLSVVFNSARPSGDSFSGTRTRGRSVSMVSKALEV